MRYGTGQGHVRVRKALGWCTRSSVSGYCPGMLQLDERGIDPVRKVPNTYPLCNANSVSQSSIGDRGNVTPYLVFST